MTHIILEPAELAYLFAVLDARTVVGTDDDQLFPEQEGQAQALYQRGFAALKQHGWLCTVEGGVDLDMRPLLFSAVMAEPERAIVTTRYWPDGGQVLAHYFGDDVIVEQYLTVDEEYNLTAMRSADTAIGRIGATLGLDVKQQAVMPIAVVLKEDALDEALSLAQAGKSEACTALLRQHGVSDVEAQRLGAGLADAQLVAEIDLLHLAGDPEAGWRGFSMFEGGGQSWFAVYDGADSANLFTASFEGLNAALRDCLDELTLESALDKEVE